MVLVQLQCVKQITSVLSTQAEISRRCCTVQMTILCSHFQVNQIFSHLCLTNLALSQVSISWKTSRSSLLPNKSAAKLFHDSKLAPLHLPLICHSFVLFREKILKDEAYLIGPSVVEKEPSGRAGRDMKQRFPSFSSLRTGKGLHRIHPEKSKS